MNAFVRHVVQMDENTYRLQISRVNRGLNPDKTDCIVSSKNPGISATGVGIQFYSRLLDATNKPAVDSVSLLDSMRVMRSPQRRLWKMQTINQDLIVRT